MRSSCGHFQILAHVACQGQGGHGGTREPHVRPQRLPGPADPRKAGLSDGVRRGERDTFTKIKWKTRQFHGVKKHKDAISTRRITTLSCYRVFLELSIYIKKQDTTPKS